RPRTLARNAGSAGNGNARGAGWRGKKPLVAYHPIPGRGVTRVQHKRISAACPLDMIWLPPDLFTSQAPRELKERMPFVSEGPNGKEWVARNGASFGLVAGVGSAGRKNEPGKKKPAHPMAETRV